MDSTPSTSSPSPSASQAEYARLRNVSRQAVNDLIARGILALGDDGRLNVAEADRACAAYLDPAKSAILGAIGAPAPRDAPEAEAEPAGDGAESGVSYHAARTMRETYQAMLAKAEYETTIGKLVEADGVSKAQFEIWRTVRNAILNAFDRADASLALIRGAETVRERLRSDLQQMLLELSATLENDSTARDAQEPAPALL